MALITGPVVIENTFDRESTELSIINGMMSVPLAVEFIAHDFSYDIVTTNDMLTQLIEPISKTINEVDQVTDEKVLRPFGIGLPREIWF